MSDSIDPTLDNCGCCEPDPAPAPIYNRPGLPALSYRAGTYATIFRRMLDRIGSFTLQDGAFSGTRPLAALTTRQQDDPSIALLDASAVLADVLTFYQERIANEGFLRTATERRSILEMAREIGYELNPGVAATVYIAFTVEDAQGAPGVADIPAGTRVQSIPPQGKQPQPFETSKEIKAYKEWNTLRPRMSGTQDLTAGISELYLQGTGANLKTGDLVLIVSGADAVGAHVETVELDTDRQLTHVTLAKTLGTIGSGGGSPPPPVATGKVDFDADNIADNILKQTWEDSKLNAFLQANEWDPQSLVEYLANYRSQNPDVVGSAFAMRTRLGIFGHNAPKWGSLPASQRYGEWVADSSVETTRLHKPGAYPNSWEGIDITKDSLGGTLSGVSFFLERTVPGLLPGGYVALEISGLFGIYSVAGVVETSVSDFAMSTKVTGLSVTSFGISIALSSFLVRGTTAYVQSEALAAAGKPLMADLAAGTTVLELDSFAFGLQPGQAVTLSGERADADSLTQKEILLVKDVTHNYGLTTLTFESGTEFAYKRNTVTLNANTVQATHGETVTEILGSGDAAQIHQKFILRKPPLTFTPAATPSGSASTLQLRVNDLLWDGVPSLYGLGSHDQDYIIRIDDPSASSGQAPASVIFGDGIKGARLPTGQNNVTATYRSGIGLAGEVDAGSLTLLPSRPLGVRGAVNPLPAGGAGDPEKMDGARSHAPLTVRTLDRVVSRQDYEDFAAAFAGIGKAQAIDLWSGEHHLVHLTIAGEDGEPIPAGDFRDNFISALKKARDPAQKVKVDTFAMLLFNLTANVAVDRRYVAKDVLAAVQAALEAAFAFPKRAFGQVVTAAEVMTVIQDVEGVVYVDIDSLHLSGQPALLDQILPASIASVTNGQFQQAQLLLINTLGITLQEVQA